VIEEEEEAEEEAGEHKSFFILLSQSRGMNSVRSLQSHLCSFPVFATPSPPVTPPFSRQQQFCVLRRAGAAIQSRGSTVTMAGAAGTDHKVATHESNGGTEFGAENTGKKFNKDDDGAENLAAYVFGIDDLRLQPYKLPPVGQTLSLSLQSLSFLLLLSKYSYKLLEGYRASLCVYVCTQSTAPLLLSELSYKLLEGCRHHPWRALIIYICSLFWI